MDRLKCGYIYWLVVSNRSRLKTCQTRGRPTLADLSGLFAMETEWDTAIARHEMFSPNWSRLSKGDTISVVINGLVFTEEVVIGQSLPDNQPIRLYGEIDAQVRGCKCLTVLGAVVDFKPPFVDLLLTDLSMTLAHGLKPATDLFKTVEFCAGLGATGVGLAAAACREPGAWRGWPALVARDGDRWYVVV